LENVLYTV